MIVALASTLWDPPSREPIRIARSARRPPAGGPTP
jgi:hypothetical protein